MSIIDRLRALFGAASTNGAGSKDEAGGDEPAGADETAGGDEMISCEDALRLVHEYLDGELESTTEAQVKSHFDVCQRCYPHLHLETTFREAVRRAAAGEAAPPELKAKVAALIAEAEEER